MSARKPPHLCEGRSALALRERVPTLITRFPGFPVQLGGSGARMRLWLAKAYAVASSAENRKSGFSAGWNSLCPNLPLTQLTITLTQREPSNHGQLP
jgi:hypothetical protein